MILTVTANPTIDRVLFVRDFAMQDLVRAEREVISPSGKGIDVALVLHALAAPTLAISLNAGFTGRMLEALLAEQKLPTFFIPARGWTRQSVLITDVSQHRQSTILAPTLSAGPEHLDALRHAVESHAAGAWGLVCAGSLPPGLPLHTFADLLSLGRNRGLVTLLDSSGPGLVQGVAGLPHILKINGRELAELAGAQGLDLPAWQAPDNLGRLAAFLMTQLGVWASEAVIVTFGREGALLVTAQVALYAPAAPVPVVSPAGAGDALAAGLMLARYRGQGWPDALRLGVAAAAAVVANEGTAVCRADQVAAFLRAVIVHPLSVHVEPA
jgi:1-phosphofructokinase